MGGQETAQPFDQLSPAQQKERVQTEVNELKNKSSKDIQATEIAAIEARIDLVAARHRAENAEFAKEMNAQLSTIKNRLPAQPQTAKNAPAQPQQVPAPAPEVKSAPESNGAMSYVDGIGDSVGMKEWTPGWKRTAVIAATVGIPLALWWIVRSFKKGKAAAETEKEKGGGFFKKLFKGILIGGAAAVGLYAAGKYFNWGWTKSLDEAIGLGKKQDSVQNRNSSRTASQARPGEQPANQEGSEDGSTTVLDEQNQEPERTIDPNQAKEAKEKGESLGSHGLMLLHPDLARKAGIADSGTIDELLLNKDVQGIPMGAMLDAKTPEQAKNLITTTNPNQLNAIYFLCLLAQQNESNVREVAEGKNVRKMSIQEYLGYLRTLSGAGARMATALNGKKPQEADLQKLFGNAFHAGETMREFSGDADLAQEVMKIEPGIGEKWAEFCQFCFANRNSPLKNVLNARIQVRPQEGQKPEIEMYQKVLQGISNELAKPEVRNYLKLYVRNDPDYSAKLTAVLDSKLTIVDALQLFAYLRQARSRGNALPPDLKNSSALGSSLLQLKVLELIRNDPSSGQINEALMRRILANGEDNGVLPEGAREIFTRMSNIQSDSKAEGLWQNIARFYDNFPTTTTSIGLGIVGYKGTMYLNKKLPMREVGGIEIWKNALKSGGQAGEVAREVGVVSKLEKALSESPAFARTLSAHLNKVDKAQGIRDMQKMNRIALALEDPALLGMCIKNPRVLNMALKATTEAEAANSMVRASRMARLLSTSRRIPGGNLAKGFLVLDYIAIVAVCFEIDATRQNIERLEKSGASPQRIALEKQKYLYHAADLGIAGAGAAAGTMIVLGVGTAVAWPVALATLPLSAIAGAAYQGHEWEIAKARTVEDWQKEFTPAQLLMDARTYGFGERVGHFWEMSTGKLDWKDAIAYAACVPLGPVGFFVGRGIARHLGEAGKDQIKQIQEVDEKKLRAVVRGMAGETLKVNIPKTQINPETEEEEPLTPDQVQKIKDEAEKILREYVDSKVNYILLHRQDDHHPINSKGDLTDMLRDAEDYASVIRDRQELMKSKTVLEKERDKAKEKGDTVTAAQIQKRIDNLEKVLKPVEKNDKEGQKNIARAYASLKQAEAMQVTYAKYLKKAMDCSVFKGVWNPADDQKQLEQEAGAFLIANSQNTLLSFHVRVEDEGLRSVLPDSGAYVMTDAVRITRMYGMKEWEKIIKERSASLSKTALENVQKTLSLSEQIAKKRDELADPTKQNRSASETIALEKEIEKMIDERDKQEIDAENKMQKDADEALTAIQDRLKNPKELWENMPQDEYEHLDYGLKGREEVKEKDKLNLLKGEEIMRLIGAGYSETYYTKEYAMWLGTWSLYFTFDLKDGKWKVAEGEDKNWKNAEDFKTDKWIGEEKYRLVVTNLADVNRGTYVATSIPKELLGEQKKTPEQLAIEERKKQGLELFDKKHENFNENGTYFTRQWGYSGNKYLYFKFDNAQGKWLAGFSYLMPNDSEWSDPAGLRVSGLRVTYVWTPFGNIDMGEQSPNDKYNEVIQKIAAINNIKAK